MSVAVVAWRMGSWWHGRRRRPVVAASAMAAGILAAAFVVAPGPTGTVIGAAAVLADPLSILAARSPGERGAGALVQTKRGRPPAHRVPPAPVVPVVPFSPTPVPTGAFVPPGEESPLVAVVPASPYLGDATGEVSFGGVPTGDLALGGLPVVGGIGIGGGGVVGGVGGGGAGGAPGGSVPPPVGGTTPVPPVPEPATWMSMILGFAIVGSSLRRRARTSAAAG